MAFKIKWELIRQAVWSRAGIAAILMAPNALPISFWFFETVSPIQYNFSTTDTADFIGQLILAFVVGIFATLTGLAFDLGLVKIALSPPTHTNRFKSLNFYIPVAFCVMAWLVIYDYYSGHQWELKMTTITHLAYPTASMLTALYWAWSEDWVKKLSDPLNLELIDLKTQLSVGAERFNAKVDEATTALQAQVADLQSKLRNETERAARFEELGKGLGSIVDSALESQSHIIADLRTTFQQTLQDQRERLQAAAKEEIERLQARIVNLQAGALHDVSTVQAELEAAQATIRELQDKQVEPGVFQYLTMKEAIEAKLAGDPDRLTPDQLALELRIKADQLPTFRSQVSQIRSALSKAQTAQTA